MMEIPVYLITGFLESGKSTFIQEVLDSPDFADGEKTLLLLCEDGEVEFDEKEYARHNIEIMKVEDEDDLTPEFLDRCQKACKPYRVFVEYNGMWDVKQFFEMRLPRRWEIVQTITLVDAMTFDVYLNNMRSLISSMFTYTELVIFNRSSLTMDLQKFRRSVKSVNPGAMLSFEDLEGEQLEIGKEQPPYDLNADIIEIADEDYGLWYLDMTDTPERYEGRTVRFKGKVMIPRRISHGCFIPGRNAMTCCADDIRFIGYVCKTDHPEKLNQKEWLEVTATVTYEYVKEYQGEGPVLHAMTLEPTEAPAEDLVYFN